MLNRELVSAGTYTHIVIPEKVTIHLSDDETLDIIGFGLAGYEYPYGVHYGIDGHFVLEQSFGSITPATIENVQGVFEGIDTPSPIIPHSKITGLMVFQGGNNMYSWGYLEIPDQTSGEWPDTSTINLYRFDKQWNYGRSNGGTDYCLWSSHRVGLLNFIPIFTEDDIGKQVPICLKCVPREM